MGSQKPTKIPLIWVVLITSTLTGLFTFSIRLDIPITNLFSDTPTPRPTPSPIFTPTPIPTPSPNSTPTPTLIPTSTPIWSHWPETAIQIPYKELFRYAESHIGEKVYFRAKIFQVIEDSGDFILMAQVTPVTSNLWDDVIRLKYDNAPVRILDDDIVHLVGIMEGLFTYETIRGSKNTVPFITVLKLVIE